jgi:carbonic anhydrase
LVNIGHALQADFSKTKSFLTHKGKKFQLAQFHLHTPSEHRLNGRHLDLEVHFVSKSQEGRLLVSSVLFEVSDKSDDFFRDWRTLQLPMEEGKGVRLQYVGLGGLVKSVNGWKEHWTYQGSLTTPPCTEGVTWVISKRILKVSWRQLNAIKNAVGYNARPVNEYHKSE